jgi:hypothetical protein
LTTISGTGGLRVPEYNYKIDSKYVLLPPENRDGNSHEYNFAG